MKEDVIVLGIQVHLLTLWVEFLTLFLDHQQVLFVSQFHHQFLRNTTEYEMKLEFFD